MTDARWNLPTVDLAHRETFEHCALRVLDRQVGLHASPPTAALLRTTQTVPTDILPNGGEHTITAFMGLWVKEENGLDVATFFTSEKASATEWRWVSWDNMSIKSCSNPKMGTKESKSKMTLSEFYDLVDPLKQLKWLHYTDDFHPVEELKTKIAAEPAKKSGGHCCVVQ
jgi:ADP-ribose pyrophosphatase YjhB (NUDIX family)